jgi:hypothetical protein
LSIVIVCLLLIQIGVINFKTVLKNTEELARYEREKSKSVVNVTVYGSIGIDFQLSPPPLSIFFNNSGLFNELMARIDIGDTLDIYINMKGKNLFRERALPHTDFSGWLHFVGILCVLFLGLETLKTPLYLKTVNSFISHRAIYWYTVLSRFLIISILFILIIGLALLLVLLNGIELSLQDYKHIGLFSLNWILVSFVFFMIGVRFGMMKKKSGGLASIIVWISCIYLFPFAINKIGIIMSENIPSNISMDIQKWTDMNSFEERAKKEYGKSYPKIKYKDDKLKELATSYLDREYLKIETVENVLLNTMKGKISVLQKLSMLIPSMYYNNLTSELSGKGFGSTLDFLKYLNLTKNKFVTHVIREKFFSDKKFKSFVNERENIYMAKSSHPAMFFPVLVICIYLSLLLSNSYRRFRHILYGVSLDKNNRRKVLSFSFENGVISVFEINDRIVVDLVLSHLSGKSDKNCIVKLELMYDNKLLDQSRVQDWHKYDFHFICTPIDFPGDVKVSHFMKFLSDLARHHSEPLDADLGDHWMKQIEDKRLDEITPEEGADLSMWIASLKNSPVYIFHDTVTNMKIAAPIRFWYFIKKLTGQGKAVAFFTTDAVVKLKPDDQTDVTPRNDWIDLIDYFSKVYI